MYTYIARNSVMPSSFVGFSFIITLSKSTSRTENYLVWFIYQPCTCFFGFSKSLSR